MLQRGREPRCAGLLRNRKHGPPAINHMVDIIGGIVIAVMISALIRSPNLAARRGDQYFPIA